MAVGIIIGAAFGKIVSSLVNDMVMPLIGILLGNLDFSALSVTIGESEIAYGMFLQSVIDFLIIAFAIFIMIKQMNRLQRKPAEKPEEAPADVRLLTEIRDLLKKK